MSIRLALVVALLFGILVAYLTSLNTGRVHVTLAADWGYDVPLMALVVGAFLGGAALALLLGALRDLARSYRGYQFARRARRDDVLSEIYHRGVDAQLAGRPAAAVLAYEEVLRRQPAHSEAPARLGEMARQRGDREAALRHDLQALRANESLETLLAVAEDYRLLGRPDDAIAMYQRVLERDRGHLTALRGLRDVEVERGQWAEALEVQVRLIQVTAREERAAEEGALAGIHYELGRSLLDKGDRAAAVSHLKEAVRSQPDFVPATLLLGDIHLRAGEAREALRVWERALETQVALPLLARLEQLHRAEGRPTRMISLYQNAVARQPENLAVAFGLGRVYFELAMLDEAADQFQKMEVRTPDMPLIHAYLGAILERRGQSREAMEEYRRALRLTDGVEWPHRCAACGAAHPRWTDRCPACRRWNTSRP